MTTKAKRLKMKRGKFKIITRAPGEDKASEHDVGGVMDASGCFGIHPSRCDFDPFSRWGVTHVPTMHKVGQFGTREQCRAYIVKLLAMADVDWTRSDVPYYHTPGISARVREAYQNT